MRSSTTGSDGYTTGSYTTVSSGTGSSTFSPDALSPVNNTVSTDAGAVKPDDLMKAVAKVAAANAERILNERLTSANQMQVRVSDMLKEGTDMLESSKTLLDEINNGLSKSTEMQGRLEADISNIKGSAVSALSIFVSFFAFITVSINVFSKAESVVSAAALLLIFWCLLVGFNVVIGWQFNTLKNTGLAWFLLMFVSVLSVFAVIGMYHFSPEMLKLTKAVIQK
ncbi:hypothetical protein [Pseudomonas alabamensis]|uniref:hypothetical protein n=1 Tax=Pseudomonas alabamensis TaxID=3064349 RepID=UPI003F649CD3